LASTPRGFGMVVTEGPRRLVRWDLQRLSVSRPLMTRAVLAVIRESRPLFVAFEADRFRRQRLRGQVFAKSVQDACKASGVMLLPIEGRHINQLATNDRATKWHLANALAEMFPELRQHVPRRRERWVSEDERLGYFMALAAAVAAWEGFRGRHT
jgi:hypothetical protein